MKELLRVFYSIIVLTLFIWPITLGMLLHDIYDNIFIDIVSFIISLVYIFYLLTVKDNKVLTVSEAILKKSKFYQWLTRTE